MDAFLEALTVGQNKIPPEFDWFAPCWGTGTSPTPMAWAGAAPSG